MRALCSSRISGSSSIYWSMNRGAEMREKTIRPGIRPRGSRCKPIDEGELRKLYVDNLLPIRHVAKLLKVDRQRVVERLELLGIEKRPRGPIPVSTARWVI